MHVTLVLASKEKTEGGLNPALLHTLLQLCRLFIICVITQKQTLSSVVKETLKFLPNCVTKELSLVCPLANICQATCFPAHTLQEEP